MSDIEIRESHPTDLPAIETIYPLAFPDEDLPPLVRKLLSEPAGVLSVVAESDGDIVGHVIFTTCGIGAADDAALLGPLAVAPARQRQGIGGALIRDGFARLESAGIRHVYVLGDPNYYRRSGFEAERRVTPPYKLPAEWDGAWQSISLGGAKPPAGTLRVPAPWMKPDLWLP